MDCLEYASMEAVRVLCPVLDDFERAMKAESSADKEYAPRDRADLYTVSTKRSRSSAWSRSNPKGQPFDPQLHHAVDMVETEEAPDHTVLDEFQRAYNFKGRLLRPAMVKVAVQPTAK